MYVTNNKMWVNKLAKETSWNRGEISTAVPFSHILLNEMDLSNGLATLRHTVYPQTRTTFCSGALQILYFIIAELADRLTAPISIMEHYTIDL